jgi:hypothetical protein
MKNTLTQTGLNRAVALPQIRFTNITKGFFNFTIKTTFNPFMTLSSARCAGFIPSKR